MKSVTCTLYSTYDMPCDPNLVSSVFLYSPYIIYLCELDVKHDTNLLVNAPQCDFLHTETAFMAVSWSFGVTI